MMHNEKYNRKSHFHFNKAFSGSTLAEQKGWEQD